MAEPGWALVTGAARRIGRELALTAARAGDDRYTIVESQFRHDDPLSACHFARG